MENLLGGSVLSFVGLTLAHGRGHLARAVLEGAAYALRHVAEPIVAAGLPIRELRLAGRPATLEAWGQIKADVLGDQAVYLQEGMVCMLSVFEASVVAIELPQRVTLEVTEADPSIKGQTAASSYKKAVLENGLTVQVPPFIETGDKVIVSTDEVTYVKRAE